MDTFSKKLLTFLILQIIITSFIIFAFPDDARKKTFKRIKIDGTEMMYDIGECKSYIKPKSANDAKKNTVKVDDSVEEFEDMVTLCEKKLHKYEKSQRVWKLLCWSFMTALSYLIVFKTSLYADGATPNLNAQDTISSERISLYY
jgi:hypothetical protein